MKQPLVDNRYMARVFLAQARARRHQPAFHATLLRWAAERRLASMQPQQQPELFQ